MELPGYRKQGATKTSKWTVFCVLITSMSSLNVQHEHGIQCGVHSLKSSFHDIRFAVVGQNIAARGKNNKIMRALLTLCFVSLHASRVNHCYFFGLFFARFFNRGFYFLHTLLSFKAAQRPVATLDGKKSIIVATISTSDCRAARLSLVPVHLVSLAWKRSLSQL